MEIQWDKQIFMFSVIVKINMQKALLTAFSFPGVLGIFAAFYIMFCLVSLLDHQKSLGRDCMSQNMNLSHSWDIGALY